MSMEEIWKDIPGYENVYQVSNLGKVRKIIPGGFYMLKQSCSFGYKQVSLQLNKYKERIGVHRLVALAFVDGYSEGFVVNHKDENRANNYASNLEWVTPQQNNLHNDIHIRRAIHHHQSFIEVNRGLVGKQKDALRRLSERLVEMRIKKGLSRTQLAEMLDVSYCTINHYELYSSNVNIAIVAAYTQAVGCKLEIVEEPVE